MNLSAAESQDLHDALHTLRERSLAAPQSQRLNELLARNVDARQLYLEHLLLAAELRWLHDKTDAGAPPVAEKTEPIIPLVDQREANRRRRFKISSLIGLAASLLLIGYFATIAGMLMWDRMQRTNEHDRFASENIDPSTATLTHADNASWQDIPLAKAAGKSTSRTLQVRDGHAELKFAQGAEVIVEGPAEFEVRSSNSGFLRRGKLSALVPKQAIGFMIETPAIKVVDLGTEFGVEVRESGATDVQVAQGKVELRSGRQVLSASSPTTIVAGEARTIEPGVNGAEPVVRKITASPNRFARMPEASGLRRIAVGGALASSTFPSPGLSVNNLINGSGLHGECHSCNSLDNNMWHSLVGKVKNEYLLFDLVRPYRLQSMKVWNYNDYHLDMHHWRGVKQADIYISSTGRGTPLDHPEAWKLVAEDMQFEPGTGTSEYDTPTQIPLNDVTARFVAIVIDEALGHDPRDTDATRDVGDLVGLSEVQFFGVRANSPKKESR
jgi:hypothetical protein